MSYHLSPPLQASTPVSLQLHSSKSSPDQTQTSPPEMYEDSNCFEAQVSETPASVENELFQTIPNLSALPPPPVIPAASATNSNNSFEENLTFSMEELAYHPHHHQSSDSLSSEFNQKLVFHSENSSHFVLFDHPNWNPNIQEIHDMGFVYNNNTQDQQHPDLLNLFNLPKFSEPSQKIIPNLHNYSLSDLGDIPTIAENTNQSPPTHPILYDPLFPLNLPPHPPIFRDLFRSLPHGYSLPSSSRGRGGSLFGEGDDREGSGAVYEDGDGSGVLEFSREMADCIGKGKGGKKRKHFPTERQRRVQLNEKFAALKSLVPKPTKGDRTSIVGDAIEYIRELLRTVKEYKLMVEKKRCERNVESLNMKQLGGNPDESYNLRSSWLQRKSKDTEVDVRIVDDEVTIKLVQRKVNCLLHVSKVLDDLHLDLHHVAGGHIGDYYSFLFNTKIYEGSCVYASAIANKVIQVVDKQYAAAAPYH